MFKRNSLRDVKRYREVIGDLMKHKHRFVVMDTETYKEKVSFQLSGMNVFVFLGITALVLIFLTALLLALTPLRELIPGYSNPRMVQQTYENARIIDSLEEQVKAQEEMLADIQAVMMGKDPAERRTENGECGDAHGNVGGPGKTENATPYVRSKADSLLREEVEEREK